MARSTPPPPSASGIGQTKWAGVLAVLLIGCGLGVGALLVSQRDAGTDAASPGSSPGSPATEPLADLDAGVGVSTELDAAPTAPAPTDVVTTADSAPATSAPASTVPASTVPADPTTADSEAAVPASVDEPVTESSPPVTVADPAAAPAGAAESLAIVRNGQIYLEGAVPTAAIGEEIAALAAGVLGPDNVFNNYHVDPNAGDPNLGNVTVDDTIKFTPDSSTLLNPDELLLNQGLALMNVRPTMTVTIVGHTDDRGTVQGNDALSLARAESVKAWFVERGVDPLRLSVVGAGSSEPIASNDTVAGRTENRRIQFFLENILGTA